MSEIDKFSENISRLISGSRQAQLRFAVCKSVNWEERTMTATGVSDGAPYEDVCLGFGYVDVKPKVDTVCLIGILEGEEALTFLINAEEVELASVKAGKIIFNEGGPGLVKADVITGKINVLERDLNSLKNVFKTWITVPNDGGASLRTAAASWAGSAIAETKQADIEDIKILHG
jgi:hypothetical protein